MPVSATSRHETANLPARPGRADDLEDLDLAAAGFVDAFTTEDPVKRRQARDELIGFALPFAGRLARRYRQRGEPTEDLEQVARLGLVKAVDRFDPGRGSFTAYAAATVTGELKRYFRDRTWGAHVPRGLRDLSVDVVKARASLTHELSRQPTGAEVAERLEIGEAQVRAVDESRAAYGPLSLDAPIRDGEACLGDLIGSPDGPLESLDERVSLRDLLTRLPRRERRLLAMRFYGNMTQAAIATELDISQMHVSRLLSTTLTWLREGMLGDRVPPWPIAAGPDVPPVAITVVRDCRTCVVRVVGEIDRDTAADLRRALARAATMPRITQVRVDLARVTFIDAAGASALLCGHGLARHRDVRLRLVGVQPYVQRVLLACGLARSHGGRTSPRS
jgi:RNA polymerase sigma-B factor